MMNYLRLSKFVFTAVLLSLVYPFAIHSHTDYVLEAKLADDPNGEAKYYKQIKLLAELSNLYHQLGEEEKSKELFNRSQQNVKYIKDQYLLDHIVGHSANETVSTGDFQHAVNLLNTIEDTGLWIKTAWKIAGKAAKAKQPDITQELLKQCEEKAYRLDQYLLRCELLSGTGAGYRYLDPEDGIPLVYEAYGMAQGISDPYERAIMFNEAGAHAMDIQHRDKAKGIFKQVDQLIDQIADPLQQAQALAMLGGEQAEKGERENAAKALDRGVVIAQALPPADSSYAVQSEIARNYGQCYQFEKGIVAADAIADPYHRAEGYIRIVKNMYRQHKQEEAGILLSKTLELSQEIEDPYLQGVVWRKIASEYITMEENQRAKTVLSHVESIIDRIEK